MPLHYFRIVTFMLHEFHLNRLLEKQKENAKLSVTQFNVLSIVTGLPLTSQEALLRSPGVYFMQPPSTYSEQSAILEASLRCALVLLSSDFRSLAS